MTIFNQSKITNKVASEHLTEFTENVLSTREKMPCLEDNLDSVHCILLGVHVLTEHVVTSFNLYQNRAEKGAVQRSLLVKSIKKVQTDTEYLKNHPRSIFSSFLFLIYRYWVLLHHFQQSSQTFIIHCFDGMTFSVFPDHP